jgi:hypothetical protein
VIIGISIICSTHLSQGISLCLKRTVYKDIPCDKCVEQIIEIPIITEVEEVVEERLLG